MHGDRSLGRRDFWTAYTLVDYALGIRLGDLRRLRFDGIDSAGNVRIVQRKTGRILIGKLSVKALAAVVKLKGRGRVLVFGGLVNSRNAQKGFRKIVDAAGLKGSTKWIRRTGATYVEIEQPGSAPVYLGHSDRRTAYRSYVDQTKLAANRPQPPEIET